MFKNLTIPKKLYLGFAIMIAVIIIITVVGVIKVNFIDATLHKVVDINSVKQRYAINFRGSVHDRAIAIRDLVLAKDSSTALFKDSLSTIRQLEGYYIKSAKPLDKIMNKGLNVDKKEKQILSSIKNIEKETLPLINSIIELKKRDLNEEARFILINKQVVI